MQATGSGTTALKLRVWKDGAAEPATWQAQTTDTTSALQAPRGVGERVYVSATVANGPVVLKMENLRATNVG